STFLKIGTITLLAIGILVVRPYMQMPAVTRFIDGSGPVWAGSVFPFLFITIACGAVSGWHALIAASAIHPGVYFAMNSAAGLIGTDPAHATEVITNWGFTVTPEMLTQIAHDVGETSIMSRTGGAP